MSKAWPETDAGNDIIGWSYHHTLIHVLIIYHIDAKWSMHQEFILISLNKRFWKKVYHSMFKKSKTASAWVEVIYQYQDNKNEPF